MNEPFERSEMWTPSFSASLEKLWVLQVFKAGQSLEQPDPEEGVLAQNEMIFDVLSINASFSETLLHNLPLDLGLPSMVNGQKHHSHVQSVLSHISPWAAGSGALPPSPFLWGSAPGGGCYSSQYTFIIPGSPGHPLSSSGWASPVVQKHPKLHAELPGPLFWLAPFNHHCICVAVAPSGQGYENTQKKEAFLPKKP